MTNREAFLIEIMKYHGIPYIYGSDDPKVGLDCSALRQLVLAKFHLDPPGDQNANQLMQLDKVERSVLIEPGKEDLGDGIYFGTKGIDGAPGRAVHVATALGNGLMLEAAGGDETTTTKAEAERRGACVRVRTIFSRKDLLCIYRPIGIQWG